MNRGFICPRRTCNEGISIALIIHSLDYYYKTNKGINSYRRSGFVNPDRAGRGPAVITKKGANLGESGIFMPAPDVQ